MRGFNHPANSKEQISDADQIRSGSRGMRLRGCACFRAVASRAAQPVHPTNHWRRPSKRKTLGERLRQQHRREKHV